MVEGRVNIYKKNGSLVGYFRNPTINKYCDDEYEVTGVFYDPEGHLVERVEFNPQALPYWAEVKDMSGVQHHQLTNVYIQKGRQPIAISGLGNSL